MKPSELRLLGIFGLLILGAITFFVLDVVGKKEAKEIARQTVASGRIREYNELIAQKDEWEAKRGFVERLQPVFRSEEEEAPALEAYFRRSAGVYNIDIKTLLPNPPAPLNNEGDMISISLSAKLSGLGPDVLQFLIMLQTESRFYAIPSISIASDRKDPSLVNVDMIFSRWFSVDGAQPTLDEVPAEPVPTTIAEEAVETPAPASVPEETTPIPAPVVRPPSSGIAKPPGLIANPTEPDAEVETSLATPVVVEEEEPAGVESKVN